MNHVYVLDFNDQIKIGRTANVSTRFNAIETGSGRKIVRKFCVEADPIYETILHDRLSDHRGVGEYFVYPYEKAVSLLQSLIAENFAEKARLEQERQRLERERERQETAQAKKQERQARKAINTPEPDTDENKPATKMIAVRVNAIDYKELNSLFTGQGTNISAAGRIAIYHLADEIKAGRLSVPDGVLRVNNGRG
jgi:hypothetical protein